jgi:hypothetical protein
MQVLNKTFFAFFLIMAMAVGSVTSVQTTASKLRRAAYAEDAIKPVGPSADGEVNKKKSKKNPAPSAQPSTFPSTMPSAQPTQKKSGKGMMSTPVDKPSY